jgi:CRISPR/Cas system CMR subunit Cmr4 (Cas7 group RAMP superfamily)
VAAEERQRNRVVLENTGFQCDAVFPANWETTLLGLLDVWSGNGRRRLVLLSNGDFAHFVKNACEVAQHVSIKPETGTAKPGALFKSSAVPSETAFCRVRGQPGTRGRGGGGAEKGLDKQRSCSSAATAPRVSVFRPSAGMRRINDEKS